MVKIRNIRSTYQPLEGVVLMLIIDFEHHLDMEEITGAIERIIGNIKNEFERIRFVIIPPE